MRRLFRTTGFALRTYAEFCRAMWLRGMTSAAKQSYTKTVLLPQTNFPARLGGRKRVEMDSYLLEVDFSFIFFVFHSKLERLSSDKIAERSRVCGGFYVFLNRILLLLAV